MIDLLKKIALLQVKMPNRHFPNGIFPSVRENNLLGYRRLDDNLFATASTVFILNELLPFLNESEQQIVQEITQNAQNAYPLYQNKDGLATYNFWKTRPSAHFPNGYLLHRFRHFKLPDDIDDTALVYLTTDRKHEEISWLKAKLQKHANPINKVYSTWFGEKMPLEHDVCALCNLMCLLVSFPALPNEYDKATINYLFEQITNHSFIHWPFRVARHYASTPLIIYHYARFYIYLKDNSYFSEYTEIFINTIKPILINCSENLLKKEKSKLEYILIETALMKLGCLPPSKDISVVFDESSEFYSFIGALLGPYNTHASAWPITHIYWKCPAHELALVAENRVWRKNKFLETY